MTPASVQEKDKEERFLCPRPQEERQFFEVMSALYNFSASGCSNKFLSTKEARTATYVFTLLLKENLQ
jgi:hypothetical protein